MLAELPPVAVIGEPVSMVDTPALLLDLDAFEHNLRQMAALAERGGLALRPHAKAHKSVAIASAQIAQGAAGICCQKLSEAYPFAAAGVKNIFISNQFAGPKKVAMAVELARQAELSVCVDHPAQVRALGEAAQRHGVRVAVLPEIDVGHERCGVADADGLLTLVDAIAAQPALSFAGIQAYHGGAQHISDWVQRRDVSRRSAELTAQFLRCLEAHGIRCSIVTGGGTGSAEFDVENGVLTEIQPGSYALMDRHYGSLEWLGTLQLQHSLFIAATIMSTARPGKAVCDVGLKSVAVDSGLPEVWQQRDADGLRYVGAYDEHGMLETGGDRRDRLGEPFLLVPGHVDPTVNLYRELVCVRRGRVEGLWNIDARGLSR
ncbi:MAG: family PLP-dependent enzyme [Burkholderiaceae bacterium]|nr:family PLP-dependent enzyme [Burkholderiaceae bacterium]